MSSGLLAAGLALSRLLSLAGIFAGLLTGLIATGFLAFSGLLSLTRIFTGLSSRLLAALLAFRRLFSFTRILTGLLSFACFLSFAVFSRLFGF